MKRTWLRSWGAGFLAAALSLSLVTPAFAEDPVDELPAASHGKLFYRYDTTSETRVTSGTDYYYRSTPRLELITFVAEKDFTGDVQVPFTGKDVTGAQFSGTLRITVKPLESEEAKERIFYETDRDGEVFFDGEDFNRVCRAVTGSSQDRVRFTLPPSREGTLLYREKKGSSERKVSSTQNFYRSGSSQLLDRVLFRAGETSGEIYIDYTGWSVNDEEFTGTVRIKTGVRKPDGDGTIRYAGCSQPIVLRRGDLDAAVRRVTGYGMQSVRPKISVYASAVAAARELGIVQGSGGRFHPNQPITRQSAMTILCRAMRTAGQSVPEAQTVLLNGYKDGGQVSGYARSSVAALVRLGVVQGTASMELKPGAAISRAEMAVILHRALTL